MGEWQGFARKLALHRTHYNHWNIGVTSVVIAQFDPPGPRAEALVAAWLSAPRFDDALSFAFGFVLTYFLTAPTYYYILLLLPFLFFAAHPDRLRGALGVTIAMTAAAFGRFTPWPVFHARLRGTR